MSAEIYKVVVFDQGLYHGNGDVYQWCQKITNRFAREAITRAPVRSGELKAGISGSTSQIGERQVQGIIESSAPHTKYVIHGTTGPIMSNKGWAAYSSGKMVGSGLIWMGKGKDRKQKVGYFKGHWMRLPADNGFGTKYKTMVSGQQPNNFLLSAWRATAADHRAIRGAIPPDF